MQNQNLQSHPGSVPTVLRLTVTPCSCQGARLTPATVYSPPPSRRPWKKHSYLQLRRMCSRWAGLAGNKGSCPSGGDADGSRSPAPSGQVRGRQGRRRGRPTPGFPQGPGSERTALGHPLRAPPPRPAPGARQSVRSHHRICGDPPSLPGATTPWAAPAWILRPH